MQQPCYLNYVKVSLVFHCNGNKQRTKLIHLFSRSSEVSFYILTQIIILSYQSIIGGYCQEKVKASFKQHWSLKKTTHWQNVDIRRTVKPNMYSQILKFHIQHFKTHQYFLHLELNTEQLAFTELHYTWKSVVGNLFQTQTLGTLSAKGVFWRILSVVVAFV